MSLTVQATNSYDVLLSFSVYPVTLQHFFHFMKIEKLQIFCLQKTTSFMSLTRLKQIKYNLENLRLLIRYHLRLFVCNDISAVQLQSYRKSFYYCFLVLTAIGI